MARRAAGSSGSSTAGAGVAPWPLAGAAAGLVGLPGAATPDPARRAVGRTTSAVGGVGGAGCSASSACACAAPGDPGRVRRRCEGLVPAVGSSSRRGRLKKHMRACRRSSDSRHERRLPSNAASASRRVHLQAVGRRGGCVGEVGCVSRRGAAALQATATSPHALLAEAHDAALAINHRGGARAVLCRGRGGLGSRVGWRRAGGRRTHLWWRLHTTGGGAPQMRWRTKKVRSPSRDALQPGTCKSTRRQGCMGRGDGAWEGVAAPRNEGRGGACTHVWLAGRLLGRGPPAACLALERRRCILRRALHRGWWSGAGGAGARGGRGCAGSPLAAYAQVGGLAMWRSGWLEGQGCGQRVNWRLGRARGAGGPLPAVPPSRAATADESRCSFGLPALPPVPAWQPSLVCLPGCQGATGGIVWPTSSPPATAPAPAQLTHGPACEQTGGGGAHRSVGLKLGLARL